MINIIKLHKNLQGSEIFFMSVRSSLRARILGLVLSVFACPSTLAVGAKESYIVVASTTSTEASGLYEYLLPKFEKKTGIDVRVVAVGTGQAIDIAERCDADVLLVHHKPSEKAFVAKGYGVERHPLMWNDFVIVGPASDPADIEAVKNAAAALEKIARQEALFASRGDDSGTHQRELAFWKAAGIDPTQASGTWYRELGQGMGPTLNIAAAQNAYTLTDRGTWISFDNRGNLEILVEGDPRLRNPYSVILVSPKHCPTVKAEAGQRFIDWLTSEEGQEAIGSYQLNGQQLFHPKATDPDA
jgi:tungstate transport system substrate-binding protein